MKNKITEAQFFALWRGQLSEAEKAEMESLLDKNPGLQSEYKSLQALFSTFDAIKSEGPTVNPTMARRIQNQIGEEINLNKRRWYMKWKDVFSVNNVKVPMAALCTLLICIFIGRSYDPKDLDVSESLPKKSDIPTSGTVVASPQPELKKKGEGDVATLPAVQPKELPGQAVAERPKADDAVTGTVQDSLAARKDKLNGSPQTVPNPAVPLAVERGKVALKESGNDSTTSAAQRSQTSSDLSFAQGAGVSTKMATGQTEGDYNERKIPQRLSSWAPAPPPVDDYPSNDGSAEQYGHYEEQKRTDVKSDPVSTFSIDVDTASYSNMRRFLRGGQLPPKDAVRVEEFLNYFNYKYESSSEKPFSVTYEIAKNPFDKNRGLLRLGIKAKVAPQNTEKSWNLVFLVDVSGSMQSKDKIDLVKESLKLVAHQMRPIDRIGIVTYAGNAGTLFDSTLGSEKSKIINAIDALSTGGGTNGSAGIDAAYALAEKNKIEGSVNRVIIATDGDFNVGNYSFDSLMKLIAQKRKSGVTLTSLGYGQGNINEKMMEQLANRGNGNFFYIDSFREARKVLATNLTANMEVVAKDVKLQIEFNPAVVTRYRLIGFDNRRLHRQDFTDDKIDAGEIGSGHTVTALYEVEFAGSAVNDEPSLRYGIPAASDTPTATAAVVGELGFLKVRFKKPDSDTSEPFEFPLKNPTTQERSAEGTSDFRFAAAVAQFGQALAESQFARETDLAEVAKVARSAKGEDVTGERAEFIELVEDAARLTTSKD